ncbi:restriction endonuclease subunit S [Sinorhizobium meliloti]|uniref:restriction endonuclease subunit S n=1 Tax=Rhizobium meliloti TaxID=382 RepID=UPI000FDA4500|nr:restriction endonuclease subunit S [Sinorhizobium meliloti]RVG68719.1 restriction endonuclease subunit S [Sinorhizobium meliloti]
MEALAKDQSHTVAHLGNSGPISARQTDIGTIPDGWDVQPLAQLLDFQNGFNAEKSSYGTGVPFANVLEVITKSHLTEGDIPGRVAVNANQLQAFLVRPGDILFNRTSETQDELGLASVYVGSAQIIFGGFVIRGRVKSSRLNATFAGYLLRAPAVRRQIVARGQGAVRANIGQSELGSVVVPLPPAHEQVAIAEALGDCNALIARFEILIAKKCRIKHGAMQELMTGRQRLPGFDGKWASKKIGEFSACSAGGTPNTLIPRYWDGSIPWMNSGELHLKHVRDVEGRITEEGLRNSAAKLLPAHCILIGLAGQGKTRGTVATNLVPLCTNQSIAAIYPSSEVLHNFLYHNLDSRYEELRELSAGDGGRGGLNLRLIQSIDIALPSKAEQKAIADIFDDLDAEIAGLEDKLRKAREVRQGMMQELLTGRVRLV